MSEFLDPKTTKLIVDTLYHTDSDLQTDIFPKKFLRLIRRSIQQECVKFVQRKIKKLQANLEEKKLCGFAQSVTLPSAFLNVSNYFTLKLTTFDSSHVTNRKVSDWPDGSRDLRKKTNPHGQGIISEVIEMACDGSCHTLKRP
ncbi:hypothetical protein J6590_089201 [Homalodisca vitripennis]|nr:hypothetical protein J6590_089201 [Homalodisca vitripennis]